MKIMFFLYLKESVIKHFAMKTSLITVLITFFVFVSCAKADHGGLEEIPNLPEKSAQLINADNAFGLDLFSRMTSQAKENTNTTVSPLSVSLALAMTYNGANGETKTEMEKAMKLSGFTAEQINNSHKALVEALHSGEPEVVFEIANAIYSRSGMTIEPSFIKTNQDYYNAKVDALPASSSEALKAINNWVAQKTQNKILSILDQVDPHTAMILLNAVYFNGIWKSKFDDSETEKLPFFFSDGTSKNVPTMKLETSLEYASNDLFSAVNLPYGNGKFQMTVLLPNEGKTTKNVISDLNADNWRKWMKTFKIENPVVVHMPRFKFSWDAELSKVLGEMGIKQAFIPGTANFTGINKDGDLYIDKIIHKTYIDVNENGTEVVAATIVASIATSAWGTGPDLTKYFIVNRPFLFAITEKTTGAILFIGEITNPEYPL